MKTAAIIILNWNKAAETRHCIQTAQAATKEAAHWIVVDNGSKPPLDDLGDGVTLLRNAENLGFAGGVNAGLRHAFGLGADHAWVLNNDAETLPGALDQLLAVARADPAVGLASPVILNADADDAVECHGGLWNAGSYSTTSDPAEYARWAAQSPERIWLTGTALLISRALIKRIGYFDEALFAYWEDNDISRRSADAGFRNVIVPTARVRHRAGRPADNPAERPPYYYYLMVRNELIVLRKTGEFTPRQAYWAFHRFARLHGRLRSLPAQRRALRRGVIDGLLGRGGPYR